jgi:hypothetical protein
VPKAKTHFVDPVSGACKNWVGVIPMSLRLWMQRDVDPYYVGNALFLRKYRPALNIMDGMWAGEGQGPGANDAFWWGWILASTDAVALDVTLARLFGLDHRNIRMANEAAAMGVGEANEQNIELSGAGVDEAHRPVKPADPSVHRFPCDVIPGHRGATIEGTLGHWKTIADTWLKHGVWRLMTMRGRPTFLFGDAEDPEFEKHLAQGPYIVLDDAARDEYKYHPKTRFIPGAPVPQSYMQNEMIEALGFSTVYRVGLKVDQMIEKMKGVIASG